jgi:MFS family permease
MPVSARTEWLAQTVKKTFISLRNRNFKLYFIGQLVSNTGNWLTIVAQTLFVLSITHSGTAVGILAACQYGPVLLLTAWGGAVADRSDKRRALMLTQSLEMAQSIGLAIVALQPKPSLTAIYVLAIVGGILLAFDNPLRRSFVSEMVPTEDLPNAVVMYSTINNATRITGPALAGILIITAGYGWCFAVDAVSYIAVLICLMLMRPDELHRTPVQTRVKGEIMAGLRYVNSMPTLRISFLMLAAIGTLSYNFSITLPLFVKTVLHGSDALFTALYSIYSVGAVVCAFIVAHRGLVTLRSLIRSAGAMGLVMIVLSLVPTVSVAVPVIFLLGATTILYMTATTAIVQIEAKKEMHGRALSFQTMLLVGTTPIGGLILGWASDTIGGRVPLLFGGVVCLLAVLFGWVAAKSSEVVDA